MEYNLTTELAASSSSPSTHQWKYDVFLSFRGADTRFSFVDHLYSSLIQWGIFTFRDDDQLQKEGDIPREIFEAIEQSRISVVIFSKNYASSTWCLDELAKILECKKSQQQIVLPIYYDVDPSHVRHQTGPFLEAFLAHKYRFKDDLNKVMRWRSALKEAANLPGTVLNKEGHVSEFVYKITEVISRKLNHVYLAHETNYPIGIDSRMQEMNDLLGVGVADVRMVGIWGIGGIGKTTLAIAVYNSVAHKFEGSCFLENVREHSKAPGGLVQLQKTLLQQILGLKISSLTNVDSGINIIKNRLRNKRVLLIIDDVDQLDSLKYLAGSSDWFGAGSRIIITTKDEHLLAHKVDFTCQVKELESDEALELFSSNAFPTSRLPDDYQVLARRFVGYAHGNPLALIAMGSLLYGKSIVQWHSVLESYERGPVSNIHEILKTTRKELEHQINRPEENFLTNVEEHAWGLNEAESNELMLVQNDTISGTPEVERLQGKISETYNEVTEQNEDENNVDLVEGDKTFSSIEEEDLLGKTPGTGYALNKVENTEKLVEGYQTFSRTQALQTFQGRLPNTEDVTGVNATSSGNIIVGTPKFRLLSQHIGGIALPKMTANGDQVENTCWSTTIKGFLLESDTVEWIFLILSFFLEILAAICDQFYSPENPLFAFYGLCLASVALFFCFCELIRKYKKGESSSPRLEMFPDYFGFICGISQCLSTVVRYECTRKGKANPFKVNLLPVIFLGCLGGRKLFANFKRCKTENDFPLTRIQCRQ